MSRIYFKFLFWGFRHEQAGSLELWGEISLSQWMLKNCEKFTPGGEYSPQQRAAGMIVSIFVSFSIRDFCWRKKYLQNLLFFIKEQEHGGRVCKQTRSFWRHFKSWRFFCLLWETYYLISLSNGATEFASYTKRCLFQFYKIKVKIPQKA